MKFNKREIKPKYQLFWNYIENDWVYNQEVTL